MFSNLYCESDFPDSRVVFTHYPACLIYYHRTTQTFTVKLKRHNLLLLLTKT